MIVPSVLYLTLSCTHEQATKQLTMSVINLQYLVIYNYTSSVRCGWDRHLDQLGKTWSQLYSKKPYIWLTFYYFFYHFLLVVYKNYTIYVVKVPELLQKNTMKSNFDMDLFFWKAKTKTPSQIQLNVYYTQCNV